MEYSISEHIHRYAVWTAARAASKSRLKNTEIEEVITNSKLRESVCELREDLNLTEQTYRTWLKNKGEEIVNLVKSRNFSDFKSGQFSFGLAAKIISIYIKTVEVLPTKGESMLAKVAHPPLDSILLKNINDKRKLRLKTNWSTFDWNKYEFAIDNILKYYNSLPGWKIEEEWNISEKESKEIY